MAKEETSPVIVTGYSINGGPVVALVSGLGDADKIPIFLSQTSKETLVYNQPAMPHPNGWVVLTVGGVVQRIPYFDN